MLVQQSREEEWIAAGRPHAPFIFVCCVCGEAAIRGADLVKKDGKWQCRTGHAEAKNAR
jgi:hypothetical protein